MLILCLLKHEVPFEAVAWRTAVFMTVFSLAVTILRSFDWSFYCPKINSFSGFQVLGQRLREMEDFRGIAEESFPSFLTNSLLGNSGILENVTLSSKLGLPVAVSTLARNRSGTDNRYSDVQASYLVEGKFLVPSESPGSQSEGVPRERLQLVFQDDDSISKEKNHAESQQLSDVVLKAAVFKNGGVGAEEQAAARNPLQSQGPSDGVSPVEQEQDFPLDFCSPSWMNKENKVVVPDAGKPFEEREPNSDLSHTSFLENERLMALASLEESSDDDIDDEEFYDDHLEAYFEQLAIPGMMYEDLEGQEPPEHYFKLPTSDPSQADKNSISLLSHDSCSSGGSEIPCGESGGGHVCPSATHSSVCPGDSRRHVDGVLRVFL